MNEPTVQPRPANNHWWVQLPTDAPVLYVTPYRVEGKRYPKWKFWRNEKIKYNLAVLVEGGRLFIVDPDALTVEEKANQ